MEQLVRVRMLSSKLSLDEYRALLSTVLDENNMEEFSSMIFNRCLKQLKTPDGRNGLEIDSINQEITDIISRRKSNRTSDDAADDETDNESYQSLNIIDCGDNLIQEIAAYLPFKSYSNFQSCCRSTFYAANSPSSLYELDWEVDLHSVLKKCFNTDNTHQIQLFMKRFERVRKLSIWWNNKQYIPLVRFRNLKHLQIQTAAADDTEKYLSENIFSWDTVTHLRLCYEYQHHDQRQANHKLEIIKRCKNLRDLSIEDFGAAADILSLSQEVSKVPFQTCILAHAL
eukprot:963247_1